MGVYSFLEEEINSQVLSENQEEVKIWQTQVQNENVNKNYR